LRSFVESCDRAATKSISDHPSSDCHIERREKTFPISTAKPELSLTATKRACYSGVWIAAKGKQVVQIIDANEPFVFATDFPHESFDAKSCRIEIKHILGREDLTQADKEAILGKNAKKFYGVE
jgi:hypothetical protein